MFMGVMERSCDKEGERVRGRTEMRERERGKIGRRKERGRRVCVREIETAYFLASKSDLYYYY